MTKPKAEQARQADARAGVAEATGRAYLAMRDAGLALEALHALGSVTAGPFAERLLRLRLDFNAFRNEVNFSPCMRWTQ